MGSIQLRLDPPAGPQIAAAGLDHFGRHQPLRSLGEDARAGPDVALAAARHAIFVAVAAQGHAGEQAREDCAVYVVVLPAIGAALFDAVRGSDPPSLWETAAIVPSPVRERAESVPSPFGRGPKPVPSPFGRGLG